MYLLNVHVIPSTLWIKTWNILQQYWSQSNDFRGQHNQYKCLVVTMPLTSVRILHYNDVITSLTSVYSTFVQGTDQRKHHYIVTYTGHHALTLLLLELDGVDTCIWYFCSGAHEKGCGRFLLQAQTYISRLRDCTVDMAQYYSLGWTGGCGPWDVPSTYTHPNNLNSCHPRTTLGQCPDPNCGLIHWGRGTHLCVSKIITIGSDNGLSPARRQAITWTNAGILLIGLFRNTL